MGALYDAIGTTYSATRQEDPRLAAAVWAGLGGAETVVNVGAGTGSYEPRDRRIVLAVEPSATMIAQRPPGAAPVVQAAAEALPLPDGAFDAAMAVLSDHHWSDRAGGLRELRRVAARAVVLTFDSGLADRFWAVRDYFPGFLALRRLAFADLVDALDGPDAVRVTTVPLPWDCADGLFLAWWRRPEALLDPRVRAGISVFARLDPAEVRDGLTRLEADLASGAWARRNAELLALEELDLGLRLLVAG